MDDRHDHSADSRVKSRTAFSRRTMLAATAAGIALSAGSDLAAAPAYFASPTDPALSPDQALAEIMAGNARFVAGALTADQQDLKIIRTKATEGQWPIVGVLSCADSRVPVEMVFDQPMGRLFVTRIAGNVTTPEIVARLEYGVAVLGTKAIVVMGHTSCGAVKAALQNGEVPGQISALFPALLPAIYLTKVDEPDAVSRMNAMVQAATLINASPVIEQKVKSGALKVVPAIYEIATGKVELLPIPDSLKVDRQGPAMQGK